MTTEARSDTEEIFDALVAEHAEPLSVAGLAIVRSMAMALNAGDHISASRLASFMPKKSAVVEKPAARPLNLAALSTAELALVDDLLSHAAHSESRRRRRPRWSRKERGALELAVLAQRLDGSMPDPQTVTWNPLVEQRTTERFPARMEQLLALIFAESGYRAAIERAPVEPRRRKPPKRRAAPRLAVVN